MIDSIYKNHLKYFKLCKEFLIKKIKAYQFKRSFLNQRCMDLEKNKLSDTEFNEYNVHENQFFHNFFINLYDSAHYKDRLPALKEYVEGSRKLGVKGELFFSGIYQLLFIDARDFEARTEKEALEAGWAEYSKSEEGFLELTEEEYEEEHYIDEKELRRRIQQLYDVLNNNKDLWM